DRHARSGLGWRDQRGAADRRPGRGLPSPGRAPRLHRPGRLRRWYPPLPGAAERDDPGRRPRLLPRLGPGRPDRASLDPPWPGRCPRGPRPRPRPPARLPAPRARRPAATSGGGGRGEGAARPAAASAPPPYALLATRQAPGADASGDVGLFVEHEGDGEEGE